MSPFEFVIGALLIILGLGITELLNDAVGQFRDRSERASDWIALTWAAIVFVYQMQFLWAIFELSTIVQSWTAGNFLIALSLVLLLFVAGALIVPRPSNSVPWDPWERFIENGRWSLIALAAYCLLAFVANIRLFELEWAAADNLFNVFLAVYFLSVFFLRSRKIWAWATVVAAVLTVVETVRLSPSIYS